MEDTRVDMPAAHTFEESVNDDPSAASCTVNGGLSTFSTSNDNPVEEKRSKKTQQLIIDANGSNWHQSPMLAIQDKEINSKETLQILDFDILCATIAMQREPSSLSMERDCNEVGVQRMWEGGVLDCFDNKEIAMQTFCCPSFTYGRNLNRAGFGSCISKGGVHFALLFGAFISYILFVCAYGHFFLYLAFGFFISVASFASYYRVQIRKKFNIKGSDSDALSAFDDGLNHFLCGCCTLCQEARTLQMNNVQDGNWHGRSDTILVGNYAIPSSAEHLEPTLLKHPAVVTIESEHKSSFDGDSYDEHRPLMVHQSA